jgi:uncharacterized tellurite resistance protein B-like protein
MDRRGKTDVIKALQKIIEDALRGDDESKEEDREHAVKVATAALLIEVARADFRENVVESEAVFRMLKSEFELTPEEAESLMRLAENEADSAVSLHGFTRLLNDELDESEKSRVIGMLWKISVADEHLHRYEDALVRKVAELLYVPHREMVRLRHSAVEEIQARS